MNDAIVTGIFTLLGAALGLFGGRYVREWGELRCEINAWTGKEISSGTQESRNFEASFYNGKDVAIALWNVRMEVVLEDGETERVGLQSTSAGGWVSEFNLPPRVAVSSALRVTVGGALLEKLRRGHQARFVGAIPGGNQVLRDLPPW